MSERLTTRKAALCLKQPITQNPDLCLQPITPKTDINIPPTTMAPNFRYTNPSSHKLKFPPRKSKYETKQTIETNKVTHHSIVNAEQALGAASC